MPLLLSIDTAVQGASVCLSDGDRMLAEKTNPQEREAAAWFHPAVQDLLREQCLPIGRLQAVAVSAGPGSYTGLRVGLSAAKGLCYSLGIPLILVNALEAMAAAAVSGPDLLAPLIDARRMEVFTAVYDAALQPLLSPTNLILEPSSFHPWLEQGPVRFFGNGAKKAHEVLNHPNAVFVELSTTAANLVPLATKAFAEGRFADLAYSEPFYGKDFHSPAPRLKP